MKDNQEEPITPGCPSLMPHNLPGGFDGVEPGEDKKECSNKKPYKFTNAWDGLDDLKTIDDFVPFLRAFVDSGTCGCDYRSDAFGASSNAAATWMSAFTDKLEAALAIRK